MLVMLITAIYSTSALIASIIWGEHTFHKIAQHWSGILLKIVGIKIELVGIEYLDNNLSYIYVANHSSLFDIPVMLFSLKDNARIMYKEELEKIPIFGYGLKKSPFISIVRTDPRNAMTAVDAAAKSIRDGDSVIIFPEGTRSEDGTLGTFKRGAFLIAAKSGKTIVPVTLIGSSKILPKGKKIFSKGTVKMIINKPIENQSDSKETQLELMKVIKSIMQENLNNNL